MKTYKCAYGESCECKTDGEKSTCDLGYETRNNKTTMTTIEFIEEETDKPCVGCGKENSKGAERQEGDYWKFVCFECDHEYELEGPEG